MTQRTGLWDALDGTTSAWNNVQAGNSDNEWDWTDPYYYFDLKESVPDFYYQYLGEQEIFKVQLF